MLRDIPTWWSVDDRQEMIREFSDCIRSDSTFHWDGDGRSLASWREEYNVLSEIDIEHWKEEFSLICYTPGPTCASIRERSWANMGRGTNDSYPFFNSAAFNLIMDESDNIPSDLASLFAYTIGWLMSRKYGDIAIIWPLSFSYGDDCEHCGRELSGREVVDYSGRLERQYARFAFDSWERVITADGWLGWRFDDDGQFIGYSPGGGLRQLPRTTRYSFLHWDTHNLDIVADDMYVSDLPVLGTSGIGAIAKSHRCSHDWPELTQVGAAVEEALTGPMDFKSLEEIGWDLLFGEKLGTVLPKREGCRLLKLSFSYKHEERYNSFSKHRWPYIAKQVKALMKMGEYDHVSIWSDKRSGVLARNFSWAERALEPYIQLPVLGVKVGKFSNERGRFWLQIEKKLSSLNKGLWTITANGMLRVTRISLRSTEDQDDVVRYLVSTCTDHEDGDLWREDREYLLQDVFRKGSRNPMDLIKPEFHMFDTGELDWTVAGNESARPIEQDARIILNDRLLTDAGLGGVVSSKKAKVICFRSSKNLGAIVVKVPDVRGYFMATAYLLDDGNTMFYKGRSSFAWFEAFGRVRSILGHYQLVPLTMPKSNILWRATVLGIENKARLSLKWNALKRASAIAKATRL